MAIARHLAIDRRLVELAHENDDLNEDISKLEAVLQLHHDLSAQRATSAKAAVRKEVGGPIWQFGGKGKMSNFKGKKDIAQPDATDPQTTTKPQSRPKSVIGVRSRPVSAKRRKAIPSEQDKTGEVAGHDEEAVLPTMTGRQVVPTDQNKGPELSDKATVNATKEGLEKEVSERRPRTARPGSARPARSQSASGPRRNRPPLKPDPQFSAQGNSMGVPVRKSAASDSEEDRMLNGKCEQQTYAEKISVMKSKVLKKMLNKVDLESKLKDFKKVNRNALDTNSSSQRRTSEPSVFPIMNGENQKSETKKDRVDSDDLNEDSPNESNVVQLDSQVESWLKKNELYDNERCKSVFKKHKITTISRLKTMTESKLRTLGITNAITLSKIRMGLLMLKVEAPSKWDDTAQDEPTPTENEVCDVEIEETQAVTSEDNRNVEPDTGKKPCSQMRKKAGEKVPNFKPAWGSGLGSKAEMKVKPRARPASAGVAPRLRPSSAANTRQSEVRKSGAPIRPRTGLACKREAQKRKENGVTNDEDDVPLQIGHHEDKAKSPVGTRLTAGPKDLHVAGAPLASPSSPGRQGDKTETTFRPPTGRTGTAKSALETMEEQIQILQEQASTTGNEATAAMVAQLQEQLLQVQKAMGEVPPGSSRHTLQISPGSSRHTPQVAPEQGSFITAALAGNVRPLSCRREEPVEDDPDVTLNDAESVGTSVKPPSLVSAGMGPRRITSASSGGTRSGATPLNMSMSKQHILKEVRKKTEEHRRTVKHLESELSRLKHKDPLKNCEVAEEDVEYSDTNLIGEGAFSEVFHGMFQGAEVAIKRLKVPLNAQDKNYFTAEVNLLRELRHPRVVLLMGVCTTSHRPLMVLEFMGGGSLYGHLHDEASASLDHAAYYQVAQDIAVGMNYLHRHRPVVLHLDLKSMNVLLTPHLRAKIADFGFSKLRHDAELVGSQRTGGVKGTPAWMAPELLDNGDITTKADVYSYAVILWEMLTRQRPYKGCSMYQVIQRVRTKKRPELPETCSRDLAQLITMCWDHQPSRRPAFQEVLVQLDEQQFPPGWKSLFIAAGVPEVALDDVEATRTMIDIVSQTIESNEIEDKVMTTPVTPNGPTLQPLPDVRGGSEPDRTERRLQDRQTKRDSEDGKTTMTTTSRTLSKKSTEDTKSSPALPSSLSKRSPEDTKSPPALPPSLSNKSTEDTKSSPVSPALPSSLSNKGTVDTKSPVSSGPPPSQAPPPPPPPPPIPPPPLPPVPENGSGLKKADNGLANKPPAHANFMGQLKASLQDVKLKPTVREDPATQSQVPSTPNKTPPPRPGGAEGFTVDPSELQSLRQKLRPTKRPHPSQLRDLSNMSQKAMSGIADVLRQAVNGRRLAMKVNSVDKSGSVDRSYTDSGWSVSSWLN